MTAMLENQEQFTLEKHILTESTCFRISSGVTPNDTTAFITLAPSI